jgi:hypothetical protein
MTDETRTRFLVAIAKQIPADRVIEVHLFPPMRQGGAESGVAVIAVERIPEPSFDVDGGYVPPSDVAESAEIETRATVAVHDQLADETAFVSDETLDETAPDAARETAPEAQEAALEAALEAGVDDEPPTADNPPPIELPPSRYIVYSARYRHTLKGIDRGKFEVSVTDEADAPLLTIDAVVRGVQRRSGDADDTLRLSGDEFRAALPALVQTTPSGA